MTVEEGQENKELHAKEEMEEIMWMDRGSINRGIAQRRRHQRNNMIGKVK